MSFVGNLLSNLSTGIVALDEYILKINAGNYNITKHNSEKKEPICGFDGITNLSFNSSSSISSYSVQFGDFSSYNKVLKPSVINLTVITEGTFEKIKSVTVIMENYKNSFELVDIQTPYGIYIGYNITDVEYELSTRNGLGLLELNFIAKEVNISNKQFSSYKNIEQTPTSFNGRSSLLENGVNFVEKATSKISKTLLGVNVLFGSKIRFN